MSSKRDAAAAAASSPGQEIIDLCNEDDTSDDPDYNAPIRRRRSRKSVNSRRISKAESSTDDENEPEQLMQTTYGDPVKEQLRNLLKKLYGSDNLSPYRVTTGMNKVIERSILDKALPIFNLLLVKSPCFNGWVVWEVKLGLKGIV